MKVNINCFFLITSSFTVSFLTFLPTPTAYHHQKFLSFQVLCINALFLSFSPIWCNLCCSFNSSFFLNLHSISYTVCLLLFFQFSLAASSTDSWNGLNWKGQKLLHSKLLLSCPFCSIFQPTDHILLSVSL